MVNYQVTDYIENNELVCFGISGHEVEEWMPKWTPKAQREIDVLRSWFKKDAVEEMFVRPVSKSDWNWTNYATRAQVRCALGIMVIRELPIKSFYARCWLTYGWLMMFVTNGLGRGFRMQRPLFFYDNNFHSRSMANYPDMLWWNLTRVLPRNPPVPDAHREWRTRQTPVFHQYHKTCYRYRMRRPRYIPWDGSQNQPVMPYLHDAGTDVINGTFTRNCNSTPGRK
jgi:hypothetical protein